uniref:uncharacterized protein LOC122597190 n=1 Tax=Erigeron canadensis TaxID=72917 RepID=UPI001CB96A39|nr:uncharacterized protein LOC122597190 [Erigeron canadensis]
MEALSAMMRKASNFGSFKGISLPNQGPSISHLLYADDCTFLGDWSMSNLKQMAKMLRVFHICLGLKINMSKSTMFGIGVSDEEVRRASEIVRCNPSTIPFTYLGIRIGSNMNRIANWDFLFDIFKKRLSRWKASCLSLGGRVTLIKAVLESLPTYYFSLFKAPVKVNEGLEGIIRLFLWGGSDDSNKIHWVGWERVASPTSSGGLRLCKLADSNKALLSKWFWRYQLEPDG